jgi:hypothetical protein
MREQKAPWNEWLAAYQRVYDALPGSSDVRCPNCGASALRLVFTGLRQDRLGYASFWCDSCLFGIHLSRTFVPDGVDMESVYTRRGERMTQIPNYTVVQERESEEEDDDGDTESFQF